MGAKPGLKETLRDVPKPVWYALPAVLALAVWGLVDDVRRASRDPQPDQAPRKHPPIDPQSCMRGSLKIDPFSGQSVTCAGPNLVDMSWSRASRHLREAGYPVGEASPRCAPHCKDYRGSDATLRGNLPHSELIVFHYGSVDSPIPPSCLTMFLEAGDLKDALLRALGVTMTVNIAKGAPGCVAKPHGIYCTYRVETASGRKLPLEAVLEEGTGITSLRFGDCDL